MICDEMKRNNETAFLVWLNGRMEGEETEGCNMPIMMKEKRLQRLGGKVCSACESGN